MASALSLTATAGLLAAARLGVLAGSLGLAFGLGAAEAATVAQCKKRLNFGISQCIKFNDDAAVNQCSGQVWESYNKCRCEANGGTYGYDSSGNRHCRGGTETYNVLPTPPGGKPPFPRPT